MDPKTIPKQYQNTNNLNGNRYISFRAFRSQLSQVRGFRLQKHEVFSSEKLKRLENIFFFLGLEYLEDLEGVEDLEFMDFDGFGGLLALGSWKRSKTLGFSLI